MSLLAIKFTSSLNTGAMLLDFPASSTVTQINAFFKKVCVRVSVRVCSCACTHVEAGGQPWCRAQVLSISFEMESLVGLGLTN